MAGADLTSAKLTSAKLIGANLTGVKLAYAKLDGAKLTGADCTGAKFTDRFIMEDPTYTTSWPVADTWAGRWAVKQSRAKFSVAELTGMRWPDDEEIPAGWERDPESGRLTRDKDWLESAARLAENVTYFSRRRERKRIAGSGQSA